MNRHLWLCGIVGMIVAGATRGAELFSESVYVPPLTTYLGQPVNGWNRFNILLSGNPILPAQDATDKNTDPFAVNGVSTISTNSYSTLSTDAGIAVGPGPVTLPGLTRVSFTGTTDINQANIPQQNLSNPPDQVQFGLVGPANNSVMQILAQHWRGTYSGFSATTFQTGAFLRGVPVVSVTPHPAPPVAPPQGQSFKYIVDFIQFTQNGISGSEWVEFPYLPGQQPTFTYGGWADLINPIHFTDTEIQLSDTQIPIDKLNFADDPLVGNANSPAFVAVPNAADVVPEPATVTLIGSSLLMALASGRRRNN